MSEIGNLIEKAAAAVFPLRAELTTGGQFTSDGLSKRELFAALIMQGLVQDPNMTSMQRAAEGAVEGADHLLRQLGIIS